MRLRLNKVCSSCDHFPHKKGACSSGLRYSGVRSTCRCIANFEVRPRAGINDGPAGSIIPKKEKLYMRFDIDDPKYRDTNVGEEMLEPKHGHSNHTFVKETHICVECLEEIEAKAKLTDELAAALSKVATLTAVDKWQEACLVIGAAVDKYRGGGQ